MNGLERRRWEWIRQSGSSATLPDLIDPVSAVVVRRVELDDAPALAELMLDAYRGTIDDEGATLDDAIQEVHAYLSGRRGGPARLADSFAALSGPSFVGACLIGWWEARRTPFVAYAMTSAAWKGRQVAKRLVAQSLESLAAQGFAEVRAVVTEANVPSERLLQRLGFVRHQP